MDVVKLSYPVTARYTEEELRRFRRSIKETIKKDHSDWMPKGVLNDLFTLYDRIFFLGEVSRIIARDHIHVIFRYNTRLTKTGGYCKKTSSSSYEIDIASLVILETFQNGEESYSSNGLLCHDRLDCVMNIFEHELTHLIIGIVHGHVKGDPIYKSHGSYFQQFVSAYFGHTAFKHSLLSKIEKAGKHEDFKVYDHVTFTGKNGDLITGTITKLCPKKAQVGNMKVPYALMRVSTMEEIKSLTIPSTIEETKRLIISSLLKVGDLVSYQVDGQMMTSRIQKVNAKTYNVGKYRISHGMATLTSQNIQDHEKTREDFQVGQSVEFTNSKTVQTIKGTISKLNPSRAVVDGYTVPYHMLRPTQ